MASKDHVLVWVDLEMTGLEPASCAIIEMAMILTDYNLNRIAPPFNVAIWQPDTVLETMGPFVKDMHTQSGLIEKVRASKTSLEDAEKQALAILTQHASYRTARLCGNSIWQDRRFLTAYMPTFEKYLHYRQIDVSSIKELGLWWYGVKYPKTDGAKHTALFDIEQSIAELAFYKNSVFKQP
jgi:oligoribonuclease